MEIVNCKIQDINIAVYNPRFITSEELNGLKNSIKEFGFVEPLVVNKRTNTLCGGHQRLKAARELGYSEVPVFYVDVDEMKEKALNIALNSQAIQGSFDKNLLISILEELGNELPDLIEDLRFDILEEELDLNRIEVMPMDDLDTDNDQAEKKYTVFVDFKNDMEMRDLYDDLISKGYPAKAKMPKDK